MDQPKRFNELKTCIPGISSKVLTQNLSELQKSGIVEKKMIPDKPEKTEYILTEKGRDLRAVMMEMRTWGERWLVPAGIKNDEQFGTLGRMPENA
ncbi:MAG: helix-turn-helix transcriptional regulator [Candidatus Methanoperedens sp.]|nr:helix-turn-helix transcriptional regulator [Candidatus Methanoperedens sp.]